MQLMKRLCARARVKAFGFHAIRHLTASILYKMGQPVSVIQAILRHKSPNTTAIYLKSLGLEETRGALEGLAARFAGNGHTPTPDAGIGTPQKSVGGNGQTQRVAHNANQSVGIILPFRDEIPTKELTIPTTQAPHGSHQVIIRRKRTA